jgi:hypothetical protein
MRQWPKEGATSLDARQWLCGPGDYLRCTKVLFLTVSTLLQNLGLTRNGLYLGSAGRDRGSHIQMVLSSLRSLNPLIENQHRYDLRGSRCFGGTAAKFHMLPGAVIFAQPPPPPTPQPPTQL